MVIFVNKTGLDLFRDNYRVVSIGLFWFSFVSFSYNGVYFLRLNVAPFLTSYDVTYRKINTSYYTPLYENEQNERNNSSRCLLYKPCK